MPTITTTNIRNEGNTIYIGLSPEIGVLSIVSFSDNATGEAGGVYFNRSFRYSLNGVTWSDWLVYSLPTLTGLTVATTDTLCFEFSYDKVQPLGSDLLSVSEVSIVFTQIDFATDTYFQNSIFEQFFGANDSGVLNWAISVLQKLYAQGIIPPFISRLNEQGLPDDFVQFFGSITKFFAFLVNYARAYQDFNQDTYLTAEYLEQRGIKTHIDDSLEHLNNLMNTFYRQIGKRGTKAIIESSDNVDKIGGELLRLIYYALTDEFMFTLFRPELLGWCLDVCSPQHTSLYFDDNINKSYEQGMRVLDLSVYPDVTGDVSIVTDDGNSTMYINGAGGFGGGSDGLIKIDSSIDYEISFLIKKSVGATLNFSCTPYTVDNVPLNCKSVFDGTNSNKFLVNSYLVRDDMYIQVTGVLYNNLMVPALGRTMELNQGTDLILPVNATQIIPSISISSGTANIYGIRVMPTSTPYTRGFLQCDNFISAWMRNNNNHYTFNQIEQFSIDKLLPYNCTTGFININNNYGTTYLQPALVISTILYPLMRAAPDSSVLPSTSGFYQYAFGGTSFITANGLIPDYLSNNEVYYDSIANVIAGGSIPKNASAVGLSMPDELIPYKLTYTNIGEMLVWSDLTAAVKTATFKDIEGNVAYVSPLITLNAALNLVDDYMLAHILVELVQSSPDIAVLRLTRSHPTPVSSSFNQQTMSWLNDAIGGSPDPLDPTNQNKTVLVLPVGTYTFGVKTEYSASSVPGFTYPMASAFTMVVSVG